MDNANALTGFNGGTGDILGCWKETGTTVVFITHNIEEAVYLAECVLILTNKPAKIREEVLINFASAFIQGATGFGYALVSMAVSRCFSRCRNAPRSRL